MYIEDQDFQDISTQYETERNKPLPNRIHGAIQTKISSYLDNKYEDKYQIVSEVSLATEPSSTPDIYIFPHKKLSLKTIQAK